MQSGIPRFSRRHSATEYGVQDEISNGSQRLELPAELPLT